MRTTVGRDGLAETLWPAVRRSVLGLLMLNSDREWHLREIARRAGTPVSATQREVVALTKAGILTRRVESRRVYYRANAQCPIFPDLRQILLKTAGLADVVRDALAGVAGIRAAFIYGSMAKGTADCRSDVDVFIVGEASFADITEALFAAQQQLGREITPTRYSPEEFREKVAEGHHFVTRVLSEPKIMLLGSEDDLS